ncbi:MAG: T9SS type A sorting domain-containing protein [Gilvibacter sp.]
MKVLYITISLLFIGINGLYAQDPDFLGTWYLVYVEPDTGDPPATYVDPIEPAINPYLTINEDFSFNGEIACNSYSGQFEYSPEFNALKLLEFSHTSEVCEYEVHNDFESLMFGLYWDPWKPYEVFQSGTGDDATLLLLFAFGFEQFYQRLPLSVDENEAPSIKLYPNPATTSFQISGNLSDNAKITVAGINGIQIDLPYSAQEPIDVSSLASGIYIVTISDQKQRQRLKLIKF